MDCRTCGSPLAADQRYCLECGARNGPPRLDWKAMVAPAAPADEQVEAVGPGLPSPRVAAALVLGNAAGPGAPAADAGGRSNLTILAQAPAAAVAPPAAAPSTITEPEPAAAPAAPAVDESPTPIPDDGPAPGSQDPAPSAPREPEPTAASPGADETEPAAPKLPTVKHVWVVALTGHSYDETFGPASPAPYLSSELRAKGTLLPWYHAAGHDPAAGGVALLGGQKDAVGPFDAKTTTLADQLTGLGRTWKGYVEGATAGLNPGDDPCARPADQAPRNPFLRFASITGAPECGSSV